MIKHTELKTTVKYLLSIPEIEKLTGRKYEVRHDSFVGDYLDQVDNEDVF